MIVENFTQYQPRFRAYLRFLGAKDGDEIKLYEYMAWAYRKCAEYRRINKLTHLSANDHKNLNEWLLKDIG